MTIKHVHIYVFYKIINGEKYYKCDDPHCTHYAPRSLIAGKASVCSVCRRRELILTKGPYGTLQLKRPRCLDCSNTQEAKEYRKNKDIMDRILEQSTKEAS